MNIQRAEQRLSAQGHALLHGCRCSRSMGAWSWNATSTSPSSAPPSKKPRKGLREGGLPIGSVLVRDGKIIGRGHNRRVQQGLAMIHAEIDCLNNAGRQKTYRDTVLYSTLMPCFLCAGAAVQFGIPAVVVGESETFPGGEGPGGTSPAFMRSHGIELIDLRDQRCIEMMRKFIAEHPELWNEDIGEE